MKLIFDWTCVLDKDPDIDIQTSKQKMQQSSSFET